MRIEIVRARSYDDIRDTLATIAEQIGELMSSHAALMVPEAVGTDPLVQLTLGDECQCHAWAVDAAALGFHAVAARKIETNPQDETSIDEWIDVNERHEAIINLDAAWAELGDWANKTDLDKLCDLEAWAVTIPHELLHVYEWILQTGGQTPLQVFDQANDGEKALEMTQADIEARLSLSAQDGEDAIETRARAIGDQIFRNLSPQWVEQIDLALSVKSTPQRQSF